MGFFDDLVYQHNIKPRTQLQRICRPLELLAIPVFGYATVDSVGRFCNVSNCTDLIEYIYNNDQFCFHHPYYRNPRFFRSGITICKLSSNKKLYEDVELSYNIGYQILILQKSANKIEMFFFAIKNIYDEKQYFQLLSKMELLKKFGSYFKKEAHDIIEGVLASNYNLKSLLGDAFHQVDISIPLLEIEMGTKQFLKKIFPLSRKEQECLDCFKQGKSAQGTSACLGISQRTVEHYFESIKNKLGCKSKWELLDW